MTIAAQTVVTRTNTNGSTHTFNFGYPWLDPVDLKVWLVTIADGTVALQTKDTHYTVSNTGSEHLSGGSITFINELAVATAPATGKVCVILRRPTLEQDFNPSVERYYPVDAGETALDLIYMHLQLFDWVLGRSIRLPDTDAAASMELPDATTRAGKALVFDSNGALTVGTTSADYFDLITALSAAAQSAAASAASYASTSTTQAGLSADSAALAALWATKVNGIVASTDFSAKAWAIGGTDVSETSGRGAAKEWATRTNNPVDTSEFSAKGYALGMTGITGAANKGSAKDWAIKTDGTADAADYSAKAYAIGGTGVSQVTGSAKDWAQYLSGAVDNDVGFSAKAWAIGGGPVSGAAGRGASKEWAIKTDGNVDTADASAKAWAIGGDDVTNTADRGAAKEWAVKAHGSTVDGSNYSAYHWAVEAASEAANAAAVSENPALTFDFDSSTTDADPGNGDFRLNHATPASATFLYIDNVDHFGNSITGWIDFMDDTNTASKGIVMIRDVTDPTAYAIYRVAGTVIDGTGYRKVPVTALTAGAGSFSGLTSVMFIPGVDFPTVVPFGVTFQGDVNVTGSLDVDTDLNVDGDAVIDGDVNVGGYGAFKGGAMATQFSDAGVYVGIEVNGNANMSIASAGTYGYFDIGGVNEDYKMRFLVETASGNTTLVALGTLNFETAGLVTFDKDVRVPDEVYGSGWNASLEVPTKNAVYDKIQSLAQADIAGLTTADSPQFAAVNIGHASQNTLTASGGVLSIEGEPLAKLSALASTSNALGASLIGIEDSGAYFSQTNVETALAFIGARIASLDAAVVLRGSWAANAGTFPGSGSAQAGDSYYVSTGGTVDGIEFTAGDRIIALTDNASTTVYASNWLKADYTDRVNTVAGRTGNVVIVAADLADFQENAEDYIGTMLTASEGTGDIDWTYTDGSGTLSGAIKSDAITFAKMQNIATNSLIGRDTASSGDPENILLNATLEMDGSGNLQRAALTGAITASAGSNATSTLGSVTVFIEGNGSPIGTGIKADIRFPFPCTLTGWSLLADQDGDVVIDCWKDTFANFPPTNADSITNGHEPTITGADSAEDTNIGDWTTTSVAAGDVIRINIDSLADITRLSFTFTFTRTG
jgi:hypothetical protein